MKYIIFVCSLLPLVVFSQEKPSEIEKEETLEMFKRKVPGTYTAVDEIPYLLSCKGKKKSISELHQCTMQTLMGSIAQRIETPECAKATFNGQLDLLVKYVIEKNGSISNISVFNDPDGCWTKEVVKLMEDMPKWKAGIQYKKNVRVTMWLPVKFKKG